MKMRTPTLARTPTDLRAHPRLHAGHSVHTSLLRECPRPWGQEGEELMMRGGDGRGTCSLKNFQIFSLSRFQVALPPAAAFVKPSNIAERIKHPLAGVLWRMCCRCLVKNNNSCCWLYLCRCSVTRMQGGTHCVHGQMYGEFYRPDPAMLNPSVKCRGT